MSECTGSHKSTTAACSRLYSALLPQLSVDHEEVTPQVVVARGQVLLRPSSGIHLSTELGSRPRLQR